MERAPRLQVNWFAEKMEQKLRINDHKGGWEGCGQEFLFNRLIEESEELRLALVNFSLYSGDNVEKKMEVIIREAADVANFAMMIADNAKRGISYFKPVFESDLKRT